MMVLDNTNHGTGFGCFTFDFRFSIFDFSYSVLKLFTGLATAALMAWKLTVNNAISKAAIPATANTHQLILILYAKSCNQLLITNQDIAQAMTIDIPTSFKKLPDNNVARLKTPLLILCVCLLPLFFFLLNMMQARISPGRQ